MFKGEVITVGTELLLGQITNTNSQYISSEMAKKGIPVFFHVSVGDNSQRLKETLINAQKRSNLILITGGLGPTIDDITKEVLAEVINKELILHEPTYEKIQDYFSTRQVVMTDNNRKQAMVIEGSIIFPNDYGLAVGMGVENNDIIYLILPGPPSEMKPMLTKYVIPWIEKLHCKKIFFSKILRFAGIGESAVEEKLFDLLENQTNPTIAPLVDGGEVTIRLTAEAIDEKTAQRIINPLEIDIINRLDKYYFGSGDTQLEEVVINMLKEMNLTISTAESCTGGLVGSYFTKLEGSSSIYKGGIICYTNEIKNKILKVPLQVLKSEGAVSQETAKILAESILKISDSDIGISITGVAGPDSVENKPVGLIYIGISEKNKETSLYKLNLAGSRNTIQYRATKQTFFLLFQRLNHRLINKSE